MKPQEVSVIPRESLCPSRSRRGAWLARPVALLAALAAARLATAATPTGVTHLNFESPQASNAVSLTKACDYLLAVNTLANTLVVHDIVSRSIVAEIPVGLQPVSVAAHPSGDFAYVANHVSDSVSVVDLRLLAVVATIQDVVPSLGPGGMPNPDAGRTRFDEPSQVVFSPSGQKAFVTLSQTSELAVIDSARHALVSRIPLDGTLQTPAGESVRLRDPRALAMLDEHHLVVAAFHGGNRSEAAWDDGLPGSAPGCVSTPRILQTRLTCEPPEGEECPGGYYGPCSGFCDNAGRGQILWKDISRFPHVPDVDLAVIDTRSGETLGVLGDVGTLNYGVAALPGPAPGSFRIRVTHTDARNERDGLQALGGRPWLNRVSEVVFDVASGFGLPVAFDLDAPQSATPDPAAPAAIPYGIALASDGTTFLAASGSARLLVVDPQGALRARVTVGSNPTGVAYDAQRGLVYVLNRLDSTLSVVSATSHAVLATLGNGPNPLPADAQEGARVLHDASLSGNGSFACASCHPSAESDHLVWDLGTKQRPDEKGPRTTQTLRGLLAYDTYHWDGKFMGLKQLVIGSVASMGGSIDPERAQAAGDYMTSIPHYPSPTRASSDALTPSAREGLVTFFGHREPDAPGGCATSGCHTPPRWASLNESSTFKAVSLRGLHDRGPLAHDGTASASKLRDCEGVVNGYVQGSTPDWRMGLRSIMTSFFPSLAHGPVREGIIDWLVESSTGLPGVLGRQVTLSAANRLDASALDLEEQIWREVDLEKVRLLAQGVWRAPGGDFEPVELVWNPQSGSFEGAVTPVTRSVVESRIASGDAVLTYTTVLGSGALAGMPEIVRACTDCNKLPVDGALRMDPVAGLTLTLWGKFEANSRLLTNGRLYPDSGAPIHSTPVSLNARRLTVQVDDLTTRCGESYTLQVQNPGGLLSNEFPVRVSATPPNDAGPDHWICAGVTITLGTPGIAGVNYEWTPASRFADPKLAVQVFAPQTGGTFKRKASLPGNLCASEDEATVTVFPTGGIGDIGNNYKLVKRRPYVEHHLTPLPGTTHSSVWAAPSRTRSGARELWVLPSQTKAWVEQSPTSQPALEYFFVVPSACR